MEITLAVPEDLVPRLQPIQEKIPEILRLGLRELTARERPGFTGFTSVLETLASLPTPEEVLALRASPELETRLEDLCEKSRQEGLSAEEQREWDQYRYVEHLVRLAKARAALKLRGQ